MGAKKKGGLVQPLGPLGTTLVLRAAWPWRGARILEPNFLGALMRALGPSGPLRVLYGFEESPGLILVAWEA